MEITELHRANLRKLADYLTALPDDYNQFDMSDFVGSESTFLKELVAGQPIHQCGAVACAVGHCTSIGLPVYKHEVLDMIDWRLTGLIHFGVDSRIAYGPWDWMFSSSWNQADNTPWGAAKRIYWFLDKGLPEQRDFQRMAANAGELIYN